MKYIIVLEDKNSKFNGGFYLSKIKAKRKFKDKETAKTIGERLRRELKIAGFKLNIEYQEIY